MTPAFADTFYWIALANSEDAAHPMALAFDQTRHGRSIVTTDEVLVEFCAYFAARGTLLRQKAVLIVRSILADATIMVVPQSRDSFLSGFGLFAARADKEYSLTDCISMLAMRRHGLSEALTSDHHFEQEGFAARFRTELFR